MTQGWGVSVLGLADTIGLLREISVQFDSGTVYVAGPTVEYAAKQELGSASHRARPYMRPAAERVQADVGRYARQVASAQGIPLTSEDNVLRCVALAVQNEGKRIADAKDIRDTGDLIASITIEEVS